MTVYEFRECRLITGADPADEFGVCRLQTAGSLSGTIRYGVTSFVPAGDQFLPTSTPKSRRNLFRWTLRFVQNVETV
jgi:hypothetical protein